MLVLRIIGILTAIAIGVGIVAFLFTGQRRFLAAAGRLTKYAMIFALVIFVLLAFERLIVMI